MLRRNYYMVLGCRAVQDAAAARLAFRQLIRHYHPDLVGPGGTLFLREIVEAYHVLSDAERRAYYTRGLRDAGGQSNEAHPVCLSDRGSDGGRALATDRLLNPANIIWSGLDLLAERVGQNFARGEPPQNHRAEPIDVQLVLTGEQGMAGGTVIIEAPAYFPCSSCRGSGYAGGSSCETCDERGFVAEVEPVRIIIPPLVANHRRLEIPLRGIGIHNYYLQVHVTVVS